MTTWTPTTKSSSSWTPSTKSSTAWTATSKPTPKAVAGQHIGYGAFNYSGGQALAGNNGTSWTAVIKS